MTHKSLLRAERWGQEKTQIHACLHADHPGHPEYCERLVNRYQGRIRQTISPHILHNVYQEWVRALCEDIQVALTITFTESALKRTGFDRRLGCEKTIFHLINRLNRAAFGHGVRRRGSRLTAITVIEGEASEKRLHAHIALSRPNHIEESDWINRILFEARKCRQINREMRATAVTSAGWATYLAKEGPSALALSCTQRGNT